MVTVNYGKKKNLYSMTTDQLREINPEKLSEYFIIIANSLVDMVKNSQLKKMKVLEIRSQNLENTNFKVKMNEKIKMERQEHTHSINQSMRKVVLIKKGIKKKEERLKK